MLFLSFTLSPLSYTHILHLSLTHMYTFWSWWITLAMPYSGTNTYTHKKALKIVLFLSFRTGESKREDLNLSTVTVLNVLFSSLFQSMMWMFSPLPLHQLSSSTSKSPVVLKPTGVERMFVSTKSQGDTSQPSIHQSHTHIHTPSLFFTLTKHKLCNGCFIWMFSAFWWSKTLDTTIRP